MLKGRGRQLSFGQVVLEASCLMVHEKKIGNLEERLGIALRRSLGELKKKKKGRHLYKSNLCRNCLFNKPN